MDIYIGLALTALVYISIELILVALILLGLG
jgi:hypothetical protein